MRRILWILGAGIALWFALPTVPALACTCALQTAESHFTAADVVFAGTVSGVDDSSSGLQRVFLRVDLVYKGAPGTGIEVRTAGSQDACGIQFGPERSYLVFAGAENGEYVTGLCSGTTDDLALLDREGLRGRNATSASAVPDDVPEGEGRVPHITAAAAALAAVFTAHARRFRSMLVAPRRQAR